MAQLPEIGLGKLASSFPKSQLLKTCSSTPGWRAEGRQAEAGAEDRRHAQPCRQPSKQARCLGTSNALPISNSQRELQTPGPDSLTVDGAFLGLQLTLTFSCRQARHTWDACPSSLPRSPPLPGQWALGQGGGRAWTPSSWVPCAQMRPSFLRLQGCHRGFILCAVRVKTIFNSPLSLICSSAKGCG